MNVLNSILSPFPIAGQFSKVSFEQFLEAMKDTHGGAYDEEKIRAIYDAIELPTRATIGSAGYDFKSPIDFTLYPGHGIKIPTGIRAEIVPGWFLGLFPRSGLGFKYRLQLDNTCGIIDSDYARSDNEGHIFAKITNDSKENKVLTVKAGGGFMQGIFLSYGLAVDDNAKGIRNGGFGSTDNSEHIVDFGAKE